MYGLDLFSGIGGITKALEGYVRPVAYCENDRYATAVLLSRMATGEIPTAPIWDDVTTLTGDSLPARPEIIYGGFPCQDISIAGRGAGLGGKRSGLFFEIARLIGEIRPRFVFLENVPAIHLRGGSVVVGTLADLGYDCRWDVLSASDVGANHRRDRWWLLAYARHWSGRDIGSTETGKNASQKRRRDHDAPGGSGEQSENVADADHIGRPGPGQQHAGSGPSCQDVANTTGGKNVQRRSGDMAETPTGREGIDAATGNGRKDVADANGSGCGKRRRSEPVSKKYPPPQCRREKLSDTNGAGREKRSRKRESDLQRTDSGDRAGCTFGWWLTEPNVGRVAHGVPHRVDRLRALGNSVVPAQAREAFERLMGLK